MSTKMMPFRVLHDLKCEVLVDVAKGQWVRTGQLRADQLYNILGYTSGRLPDEGFERTWLVNVPVWCVPKTEKPQDAARVWCECPRCGRALTFGKLQQHLKVHKEVA